MSGATNGLAMNSVTLVAASATLPSAPMPVPTAVPIAPSTKTSCSTPSLFASCAGEDEVESAV